MIRINLLPVKRKKKAKPLPTPIVVSAILLALLAAGLIYLAVYFNSTLKETKGSVEANKQRMAELKTKIAEVDNFEKLNKTIDDRNKIIEQLRKNQNIPAMMLDEISKNLPTGVWLNSMNVTANTVNIEGYGFSNSEVVAYVDNLKNSKRFGEVFLQESKQAEIDKIPVYSFKLTFKVVS